MQRQDFSARFFRRFGFIISGYGITFKYKGDEVEWQFPWIRKYKDKPYFSMSLMGHFKSLKDMDKAWEGYYKEVWK